MWDKLWEAIQKYGGYARDARIGAVGADQVRDLYKSDKQEDKELAKELNDKYLAANAAGIGGGATAASALTTGVIPTLVSEVGGTIGSYVGNKAGSYLDEKLDTKWITPTLSIIGGLGSGIGSYKSLVNAGTKGLLKGNNIMYGKNFVSDVVSTSLNKAAKVPYKPTYGLVKWYGPTMGKTTAAKTNPNLVDFDDYIRPDLETLASKHGMNKQQLMMSQDPTIREDARQTMLKSIAGWKQNPNNASKTLVISKSDIIQDPIYNNTPIVLKKEEFLRRNAARGETDINNSLDWYQGTRRKGGNTLLEWPDEQGVYISDIEPYIPDPHQITFTPKLPSRGTTSYKFYEQPSKLSDAEKLGIPKGERNFRDATTNTDYWGYLQWNNAYNDAINSRNADLVNRLRTLHFKKKAIGNQIELNGEPMIGYHGTSNYFTEFNHDKTGMLDPGYYSVGFYHTPDYDIAYGYAMGRGGKRVMKNYLYSKNPIRTTMDDDSLLGKHLNNNDGVIVKLGSDDVVLLDDNIQYDPNEITELVVPRSSQIKSANGITYDNNGKLIPIVKRDNFKNQDIRYQQGGKLNNNLTK